MYVQFMNYNLNSLSCNHLTGNDKYMYILRIAQDFFRYRYNLPKEFLSDVRVVNVVFKVSTGSHPNGEKIVAVLVQPGFEVDGGYVFC